MSLIRLRVAGLLAVLVAVTFASRVLAGEGVTAKAAFEKLKGLDGEWTRKAGENDKHGHSGSPKVVYKVTSNGSTVMETDFPGSDHEMISMYHLDGDDLRMTHYCAIGNQPRLKLDRAKSTADTLVFVFDGGTNLDPAKDMHIHDMRLEFPAGGKTIKSTWDAYVNGKTAHRETFELTRP